MGGGWYFNLKINSMIWLSYVLSNGKTLKVPAIIVYLHSESERFFVAVSLKFRYRTCGHIAILLSRMQRVAGNLLTLKFLIYDVLFGNVWPITSNSKDSCGR